MIQENLRDILSSHIKDLEWTVDYFTGNNTGTVYSTGGDGDTDNYDTRYRYPTYQVYIRSSDWDYAKTASEMVFDILHNKRDFYATVPYYKDDEILFTKEYYVFLISAMSDPIRVGELDNIMEYSVNFDVILTEKKGEIVNG